MQHTKSGIPRATHIFEAAIWHYAVQPVCRCGNHAKFDAGLLWYRFHRKGWDDNLRAACRHFWCRQCAWKAGHRVQPLRLKVVAWDKDAIRIKELVDEREWKRAISRYRSQMMDRDFDDTLQGVGQGGHRIMIWDGRAPRRLVRLASAEAAGTGHLVPVPERQFHDHAADPGELRRTARRRLNRSRGCAT